MNLKLQSSNCNRPWTNQCTARPMLLIFGAFTLSCGLFSGLPSAHAAKCPAGNLIDKAGQQLMRAAAAGSRDQFHSLLRRYGDIPYIATRSLGKHNKKLPAGKRRKYNRQVGLYVANGLAQNSKKFAGHSFKIVRCMSCENTE